MQTYLDALGRFEQFPTTTGMPRDVSAIRREHIEAWWTYVESTQPRLIAA